MKEKDSLVSSLMEVATVQSKQLASFSATIHDTVLWDPSTCPRPSDCSTPGHQQSWSEVVRRSFLNGVTSRPRLGLRNRFTALSDNPVHPVDAPAALTRPDDPARPAGAPAALARPDDPARGAGAPVALARPDDLARPADAPVAPTRPDLHPAASATSAPAADSICAASQATVDCFCWVTTSSNTGTPSSPVRPNHINNRGFHNQKHPIFQCGHTLPPWSHRPAQSEEKGRDGSTAGGQVGNTDIHLLCYLTA
ncbi:hypothetical protein F7725_006558, partial [Dissostichus mawsoni]